jgi:hypothetical protein
MKHINTVAYVLKMRSSCKLQQVICLDVYLCELYHIKTIPSGRAVQGVGLRPLAYCDREFESHRGHECLSVVCVVCRQVEVSATSWSLDQRSPTDCGASLCLITKTPWPRKSQPVMDCRGKKKKNITHSSKSTHTLFWGSMLWQRLWFQWYVPKNPRYTTKTVLYYYMT